MTCPRCAGLLVVDELWDQAEALSCVAFRCLNCGHWDDGVAGHNRVAPPVLPDGRTLPRMVGTSLYRVADSVFPKGKGGPPKGYKQSLSHKVNRHGRAALMTGRNHSV